MTSSNLLRLNENTKTLVTEISALSGIAQNIVKEVLEYLLIDWAIKITDSPDSFACLDIPYMGSVSVRYSGDKITPTGELSTDVDTFIDLSDNFKKMIGDLHDESRTCLVNLLQKKIENAVLVASTTTD